MGNIGSHVDLTSGRRGHQANAESGGSFPGKLVLWAVLDRNRAAHRGNQTITSGLRVIQEQSGIKGEA
jgi:hypothetical protein